VSTRRRSSDVIGTTCLLIVAAVAVLVISLIMLLAIATIDYCPPGCNSDVAVVIGMLAEAVLGASFVGGLTVSVVRLVRRRRAWWVASVTVAAVLLIGVGSFIAVAASVGYLT
jgi:hypothetical protein